MARGLGFADQQPQATTPAVPEERRRGNAPVRKQRYVPRKTMYHWMVRNIRPSDAEGGLRTLAYGRTDNDGGPAAPAYTSYIEI